jgi:hypothetical protein
MKGLSRANSMLFRKKNEESNEPQQEEKKNITINLTLNLSLDKESFAKAMDFVDTYSEVSDDSSNYRKSNKGSYSNYSRRY